MLALPAAVSVQMFSLSPLFYVLMVVVLLTIIIVYGLLGSQGGIVVSPRDLHFAHVSVL